MTAVERTTFRQMIRQELPDLLREDAAWRDELARILAGAFTPRWEIQDILARWDRKAELMEAELQEFKAEMSRWHQHWEELRQGQARLEEGQARLEEGQARLEQRVERVEEGQARLEEGQTRLEEGQARLEQRVERLEEGQARLEEGQARLEQRVERVEEGQARLEQRVERLEEGQARLEEGQVRVEQTVKRMDRRLLVLGNRWGPKNEAAVRNALQGLISGLGYTVERFEVRDEGGLVHGVPASVEIDLVVRDSELWLVEIKGRVSGDDLYTFMRKIRFYEAQTGRSPARRIIIAPLIEEVALARAREEGIECYAAEDELEIE